MKIISLALFIILSKTISAQHDFGIALDLGTSRLYSIQSHNGINYNMFPSGNIGGYYRFKPKNSRSNLLVELLISQIEGKVYSESPVTDVNATVVGIQKNHIYYHITNISLPVYYGIQFKKIGLLFGADLAIPFYSAYNFRSNITYYDVDNTTKDKGSPLYIDPINYYGRIGFEWIITNKLLFRATYCHGMNIITRENGTPWKTLQASFGVRYSLRKENSVGE